MSLDRSHSYLRQELSFLSTVPYSYERSSNQVLLTDPALSVVSCLVWTEGCREAKGSQKRADMGLPRS